MHPDDPETTIRKRVAVTRQTVVIAKSFALQCFANRTHDGAGFRVSDMVQAFLQDVGAVQIEPVPKVVQPSGEWVPPLEKVAEGISWKLSTSRVTRRAGASSGSLFWCRRKSLH